MARSKTISIYTFTTNFEAEQVKQRMNREGLDCFLTNELTYMTDQNPYIEGVQLMIKREDAELALYLLAELGYKKEERIVPVWQKNLSENLTFFAFMRPWPLELKVIMLIGVLCLLGVVLVFLLVP